MATLSTSRGSRRTFRVHPAGRIRERYRLLSCLLAWLLLSAAAPAPPIIDYPIFLGPEGGPYKNPVTLSFALYADSIGGTPLWNESHLVGVPAGGGQARLGLGSRNPLNAAVLSRSLIWLEIRIAGKLVPRRRRIASIQMPGGDAATNATGWDPVPAALLPDGRVRLGLLDFGPEGQGTPNRTTVPPGSRAGSYIWFGGPVYERTRPLDNGGPYYCDFVEGYDATFLLEVGPSKGPYQVSLTFGDTAEERGPVKIQVSGRTVAEGQGTAAGKVQIVSFDIMAADGTIPIRIVSPDCNAWALVGLDLYGPAGSQLGRGDAAEKAPVAVPAPAALTLVESGGTRDLLRSFCRFLMAERLSDGNFSFHGAWYQNAYPIRTLLAGSRILDEPDWKAAAFAGLDRFVSEQRGDGGWYSTYYGPADCHGNVMPDTLSANLADIGTMSLCLALAAPLADDVRRERYLAAAIRYADRIVLPAQLPSGAFPNGLYQGRVFAHPYSVATATQAASLAVLGSVTGNARYTAAAEQAGLWLARQVRSDGTITFAPHDEGESRVVKPTAFGDVFYVVEALTWVERCSRSEEVRALTRRALDRFLWGEQGLRAETVQGYWWKPHDPWNNSKMGGMLYILGESRRWSTRKALDTWIDRGLAWLAVPGLSRQIGVLAPLSTTGGLHGAAATGFAGVAIANLIDPTTLAPIESAPGPHGAVRPPAPGRRR